MPSADSDILQHPITHSIGTLIRFYTKPTDEDLAVILHEDYVGLSFTDLANVLSLRTSTNSLVSVCAEKIPDLFTAL